MHNALFDALGINAAYLPYAPEPENFAKAIEGFKAMKFHGANVTIPYKTEFFNADGSARLVDELSPISAFTQSVNTLYWKDGIVGETLCGTTTDPYGCVRNLEENGVNPSNKKLHYSETVAQPKRLHLHSSSSKTTSPSFAAAATRAKLSLPD